MANRGSLIPASDKVLDAAGKMALRWLLFLQNLLNGDPGTVFIPNIEGLTNTGGAPTVTGVYYENGGFIDFYVRIVPVTNTSAVAGTTFIQLPFQPTSDCPCFATTQNNTALGGIVASSARAFVPAWSNISDPVTVSGRVPVQG